MREVDLGAGPEVLVSDLHCCFLRMAIDRAAMVWQVTLVMLMMPGILQGQ